MDKNLQMTFLNDAGKNFIISIPSVKDDLTSEQIKTLMELIISKKVIETSGGDLVKAIGANVVSRSVEKVDI
ncbi:MAG TPA: DUF2922 domain-containing protein [Clostridiaceae bacterium]|nr:DUF2922 domain-containing protein [Clostridiaceae bacterium]HBF77124.1 DUF2922 domain-containing protein [Clostridiaceae bacterium]HBG38809.1 DUF2922 domain-containing protein [Clostridiaceae bacterium]HBN28656.1 DUF2922 domain-containing protein [Clostridiaceae bacterium]HBX47368.1 DUF2922 domain-containing protein [Clostridiaceae bacterium]